MSMQVLTQYKNVSLSEKFFLYLRFIMTPYSQMLSFLPNRGLVLDLGCGHGLLSLLIREKNSACSILGVDHDANRIKSAQSAASGIPNIQFMQSSLLTFFKEKRETQIPQSICLIDTIHYFNPEKQKELITYIYQSLSADGGTFLMRDPDPKSRWNRLYEWLTTTLKFTKTNESLCFFRTPNEWQQLLESIGFRVFYQKCSHPLFSDVLFIAKK